MIYVQSLWTTLFVATFGWLDVEGISGWPAEVGRWLQPQGPGSVRKGGQWGPLGDSARAAIGFIMIYQSIYIALWKRPNWWCFFFFSIQVDANNFSCLNWDRLAQAGSEKCCDQWNNWRVAACFTCALQRQWSQEKVSSSAVPKF